MDIVLLLRISRRAVAGGDAVNVVPNAPRVTDRVLQSQAQAMQNRLPGDWAGRLASEVMESHG